MADSSPVSKSNRPMLKMKQLVEAAQVPKSTILLYVGKGLLPEPVKTSPNMAWYDPVCIERIRFIKKAQAEHRLPLAAIKGLIREMDRGRDISPLLELQSLVFGSAGEKMDKSALCSASGLDPGAVDRLCRLHLLIPVEEDVFDGHDLGVALLVKQGLDMGMDLHDLKFYPEFAEKIADTEIQMREKYTRDLDFKENASLTLELTRLARGLRSYIIDRTLQKKLIEFKGLKKNKNPKNN
ncbi:MerR family transcriptional regulator [Desulfospira joergensenii]|uniref:MerR family transcriptional regulator n=1 Tax=Desulfospira joergensenii TaxID=53329 RepID=UPI0003B55165|nr:MerR family transcriptional regulator [Desulfospira joergensenii]